MNLLIKQIETLQESCVRCPIRIEIRKKFTETTAKNFCNTQCPTGKVVSEKQKKLELGVSWLSDIADNLTQSQYKKLSKLYTDKEITQMTGLSSSTLTVRKRSWGLTRIEPLLSDKTYEDYLELRRKDMSYREIANAWGVGKSTLHRFINRCIREGKK